MTRRERDERGSGTALAMVAVLLLATCGLAGTVLGAVASVQRRVESAADLAALAGAAAVQRADDGCAAAARVARSNEARVLGCAVVGDEVEVRLARTLRLPVLHGVTLRARARAGPTPGAST